MKTIIAIILSIIVSQNLIAQDSAHNGVKVGDQIPNLLFAQVMNYPLPSANISSFKGKPIILNFWATWCGVCLKTMPRLDSLQRKYNDRIQIISLTLENEGVVRNFLKKTDDQILKNTILPIVPSSKEINRIFNFKAVPHEIWIDASGTVYAITKGEDVNDKNLQSFLAGGINKMMLKRDIKYDAEKLFLGGGIISDSIPVEKSSVFLPYMKGLGSRRGVRKKGDYQRAFMTNTNIGMLYQTAFSEGDPYLIPRNRAIIEMKNPERLSTYIPWDKSKSHQSEELTITTTFSYELVMRKDIPQSKFYRQMQNDLNGFLGAKFNIIGSRQLRKVKCLAVVKIGDVSSLETQGAKPQFLKDGNGLKIVNIPIDRFLSELAILHLQSYSTPLINDTGITENVDLEIKGKLSNLKSLKTGLNKYGLDIIEKEKEIEMVVISDLKKL
ncbi:TlpA disulfide reductase family protein [Pedobacter sp. UBA4863]|uniref:TlpA family protein disulfide reductase n=1 Tax=Pedobacter sp. UBA4863 TaxID=1947060 RepID=UPI0025FC0E46|nr:TlpA disulfide reductase family protein [Pedobacter sp. UBA4863]